MGIRTMLAVFCWKCRGVRAAERGFLRLRCLTCGTWHGLEARWRDEVVEERLGGDAPAVTCNPWEGV